MANIVSSTGDELPEEGKAGRAARGALQIASGAVPLVGGILSAIAGAWSENEQAKVNRFFDQWVRMLEEEIREKEATVIEIMARLNLQDEKITARVESREFQSLVKKTFRDWAGAESEDKRVLIRNLLSNAAASTVSSDDVVRMFIDWIGQYSGTALQGNWSHLQHERHHSWRGLAKDRQGSGPGRLRRRRSLQTTIPRPEHWQRYPAAPGDGLSRQLRTQAIGKARRGRRVANTCLRIRR